MSKIIDSESLGAMAYDDWKTKVVINVYLLTFYSYKKIGRYNTLTRYYI